jgi:hypothetical protein
MCSTLEAPELGKWVKVRRGIYKGDVGYVLSVAASEVHLLFIPRLAPLDASHSKRKRLQTSLTLKLFKLETVKQYYTIEPRHIHENIYSVGNNRFEHGLIVRSYSFNSVSTGVSTMPWELYCLFRASGHPELISHKSSFPRPSEWNFSEGEEIYIENDPGLSVWEQRPPNK